MPQDFMPSTPRKLLSKNKLIHKTNDEGIYYLRHFYLNMPDICFLPDVANEKYCLSFEQYSIGMFFSTKHFVDLLLKYDII